MAHQTLEDQLAALRASMEELTATLTETNRLLSESATDKAPAEEAKPAPAKKKKVTKKVGKKKVVKKLKKETPAAEPQKSDATPSVEALRKKCIETLAMPGFGSALTEFRLANNIVGLSSLESDDPMLGKVESFIDGWVAEHAES